MMHTVSEFTGPGLRELSIKHQPNIVIVLSDTEVSLVTVQHLTTHHMYIVFLLHACWLRLSRYEVKCVNLF